MARTDSPPDSLPSCQHQPATGMPSRRLASTLLTGLMLAFSSLSLHAQPLPPAQPAAPQATLPLQPGSTQGEVLYTVQQDDTLGVVADKLLDNPERWRDLQRLNQIPNPRKLQPGSQLRIRTEWLKPSAIEATIASASNSVRIDGKPATDGASLKEGSTITTGADSAALITLPDGTRLRIPSATEVRLERLRSYLGEKDLDAGFLLNRGSIEPDSPGKRTRPLNVRTPAGNAAVRGTHFRVKAGDSGQSTVEVLRGQVAAGNRLGTADVGAGEGAWFTRTSKPAVVPLLPAPDLGELDGQTFRQPEARVQLPPLPADTRAYHVQVATQSAFDKILLDTQVKQPWFSLRSTQDGPHFVRVSRISRQGMEGYDSVARIEVAARPLPPQLRAQPPIVPGTQPVLFRWHDPEAPAGVDTRSYRLQIARDPSFSQILHDVTVPLDQARLYLVTHGSRERWWRVAAIHERRQGPFSTAQQFRLRLGAPIEHRATPVEQPAAAHDQPSPLALNRQQAR
ncbi:MAG: FecR domain-containing protein [Lautropia sp.]|nr:FecR domain-containing protein [Lautropia sp.]